MRRQTLLAWSALALAVVGLGVWYLQKTPTDVPTQRVYDEAGIIPQGDLPRFEEYLRWIFEESDVDIRLVFVRDLRGLSIEDAAIKRMQDLKAGLQGREERGLLVLYDLSGQRLRIEVGYGLEEYLPDAFIGYLMNDHARVYFGSGDLSVGLRLMLRILQDRIRSANLGDRFDPTALAMIRKADYPSGGAGASAPMELRRNPNSYFRAALDATTRAHLVAQDSPERTYQRYLEWLAMGHFDPEVSLFTAETRSFLPTFPMSKAYFDYILLKEYGRAFTVDVRGDLALLYFTNDPFVPPHFFRRQGDRWHMDLVAEVRNTVNRTGGVYTWDYRGRNDDFSQAFSDELVNIKGYVRIVNGDNRQLPTRNALASGTDTAGWTRLHFAAAQGQVGVVKSLLDQGERVDARNANGRTPLYEAAKRGRLVVVRLLIERGAAVNAKDDDVGFTPLHIASEQKHIEVVRYLLSKGADVHARNKWDQTPLWQAAWQAWHQDATVGGILLEHGADPRAKDYQGFTPLHMIAESGHAPLGQLLLSKGADVNARTERGSTPLWTAADKGYIEIVRLLLEHGADANASVEGWTPLRIAENRGRDRIALLLRQYAEKDRSGP